MRTSAEILADLAASGLTGEQFALVAQLSAAVAAESAGEGPSERKMVATAWKTPGRDYNAEDWFRMRNYVIARDRSVCAYCDDHDGVVLTADHVIPLTRGGADDPRNLVCCCVPCNNSKRDLLLSDWSGRQTARKQKPFDHIVGLTAEDA